MATNMHRTLSPKESCLQELWSKVLKSKREAIGADDNFFALGGDSVAAMKLVSLCRERGYDITVGNSFLHPTLAKMALALTERAVNPSQEVLPFSLASCNAILARQEAAEACAVGLADIEDVYPCTPTQQSLFTFSLKSAVPYIAQRIFSIPNSITVDEWKKSWQLAVQATPMLRVRVYRSQNSGLEQVVVNENISWLHSASLTQHLEDDRTRGMDLGQPLARYAVVSSPSDTQRYMVWTIHHVLYDGWSEPKILEKVWKALRSEPIAPQPQLRNFVSYLKQQGPEDIQEFWAKELQGAVGPQFPQLPSRHFVPDPKAFLEHELDLKSNIKTDFTLATLIRGAWALVASQYTRSDDVVFCETFTGRDIPLDGVEDIEGPMIATTPVRVRIDRASTVGTYLQSVQESVLRRTTYQHCGMQNIKKASRDAEYACEARTGLVIQTDASYSGVELGFHAQDALREALHFNPYPLMLACGIRPHGFRVCVSFDSGLVSIDQVKRILDQLETAFVQLTADQKRQLSTVCCLPAAELDQIWQLNKVAPLSLDSRCHKLRAGVEARKGSVYPPLAVSWVCDPRDSSSLSPIGCVGELWIEGDFVSDASTECPVWLTAGSPTFSGRNGRVQATGDLVQLQADGSLIFIGRKEDLMPVQGHTFDIANLEEQFRNHLPSTIRSAAALYESISDTSGKSTDQRLILFVQQQASEAQTIDILSADHEISLACSNTGSTHVRICASISQSLAEMLRKLNKFAEDTLQPYMIPYAYIVVDSIPNIDQQDKDNKIAQMAKLIPPAIISQFRESLRTGWLRRPDATTLTSAEDTLLRAWATILAIDPDHIDVDDNFFRLGGDSVLAMKLVSTLRSQGHILTVADLFQHTRLCDVAKAMNSGSTTETKELEYEPFSLLATSDHDSFIAKHVRPSLQNPDWSVKDVMPVTDSQALDIRATINTPRTSVQYTTLYFGTSVEEERLLQSCDALLATHDILRTVFVDHESSFLQVVVKNIKTVLTKRQCVGNLEDYVRALCAEEIDSEKSLGVPFFQMFYISSESKESYLVIALSHAQYDGMSLPCLLRDLEALYTGKTVIDPPPFSTYMARIHNPVIRTKAVEYWREVLQGSELSVFPKDADADQIPADKAVFLTSPIQISSCPREITMANLLTAAWALVLARQLRTNDVTFGSITSGRQIDMDKAEHIMGPCYQFTPVRVRFDPSWTGLDLMHFVQRQSAQSAAHDHLGFHAISQECAEWSEDTKFFASVVNHQDWEDFDTMPFADDTCRVDIVNPHGDAAYPLKVVSFVKDGEPHAGIVGSERKRQFVNDTLDELVRTLHELADGPTTVLTIA